MGIKKPLFIGMLTAIMLTIPGCDLGGEDAGACVSSPVSFSFGLRVYCQNNFDRSECSERDAMQVNGADEWVFYEGQTCASRDLEEGSNPWP